MYTRRVGRNGLKDVGDLIVKGYLSDISRTCLQMKTRGIKEKVGFVEKKERDFGFVMGIGYDR